MATGAHMRAADGRRKAARLLDAVLRGDGRGRAKAGARSRDPRA